MESLSVIYKIGHGPSSSHTIGPTIASKLFRKRYPDADKIKVILYGSLALTGKGHMTDVAIKNSLLPIASAIEFNALNKKIEHPNTMDFIAYKKNKIIGKNRIYSVGGGNIKIKGEGNPFVSAEVYKHNTFDEIKEYCLKNNLTLIEYIKKFEPKETWEYLEQVWITMKTSIENGVRNRGTLPGTIGLERRAFNLFNKYEPGKTDNDCLLMAYAYAVSESNAAGGIIVTAPTCGASGVLPAVIAYGKKLYQHSHEQNINALAIAGLIGMLIKTNGSISGAEAGCQAEVGSACCMAAAAWSYLKGLNIHRIENAIEIAMEQHLGLTCDPVLGYVQIPCIERNVQAAACALISEKMASVSQEKRIFSFDEIIKVMLQTGKDLKVSYRETSKSGLAKAYLDKKAGKLN